MSANLFDYSKGTMTTSPTTNNNGDDDVAYKAFRDTLPDNLKNTKDADSEEGGDYRSRRYWELNGKPQNFQEGVMRGMFTQQEDGYHSSSVAYNEDTGEYEFMKTPDHPTIKYELDWYNSNDPDAVEFRKQFNLDTSGKYYKYVPKGNMFGL